MLLVGFRKFTSTLPAMSAWTPLWQDYRYDARAPLEVDLDVDVCVIGGGRRRDLDRLAPRAARA